MRHCILTFFLLSSNYLIAQNLTQEFLSGELYVKFSESIDLKTVDQNNRIVELNSIPITDNLRRKYKIIELENSFSFLKGESSTFKNIFRLKFNDIDKMDDLMKELQKLNIVDFVQKIPIYKPSCSPNDPLYSTQYSLDIINAEQAWCLIDQDTTDIIIGIVDGVFHIDHEDLQSNFSGAWDIFGNDDDVSTDSENGPGGEHGTTVASICSAVTNNDIGMSSLGNNLNFVAIKAGTDDPFEQIQYSAEGILRAAQDGAKIINLSYGSLSFLGTGDQIEQMAINEVVDSFGCIVVASAGNFNATELQYPAAHDNVIAVAASDAEDLRWDTGIFQASNYGDWVDITAPGDNISVCTRNNGYSNYSGTSFASPMVAALLGLVWKANPSLTREEVIGCVLNTAAPLEWSGGGAGRIDALAAVNCALGTISSSSVDFNILEEFSVFPNPTSEFINIKTDKELNIKELIIFNIHGKVVFKNVGQVSTKLDISHLATGIFYLKIIDEHNRSEILQVVKTN